MKKSTSISVLVMVSLAVGISHVGWAALDNGILLNLDGRHIDIVGMAKDRYTKISRNCSSVSRLKPEDKEYQSAVRLIIEYSPPHSQSVQLSSVWGAGNWTLAEAEFADLLPAVVLIDNSEVEPKKLLVSKLEETVDHKIKGIDGDFKATRLEKTRQEKTRQDK